MNLRQFTGFSTALLLGTSCFSQEKIEWGIQVRPQMNWLYNKDDAGAGQCLDYVPTYGYTFGFTVLKNFTDHLSLSTGIFYSKEGQKYKGHTEYEYCSDTPPFECFTYTNDYKSEFRLKYFEFPV